MLVEDLEALQRVREYLASPDFNYVAFDTETTGVTKDSEIIGFSVSAEESIGIYIVLAHWQVEMLPAGDCAKCKGVGQTGKVKKKDCKNCNATGKIERKGGKLIYNPELKAASKALIEDLAKKKLIMHNSPFDCDMVRREFKIDLMPSVHTDTMELWHLLDENELIGLKELGERLFGVDAKHESNLMKESVKANGGIWIEAGKNRCKEMYKADKDLLGRYGAKDTILTLKLFYEGIPRLFEEGLDTFFYDEESMPLMRSATDEMNSTGMKVDQAKLKEMERTLTLECQQLKREIEELVDQYIDDTWPFKDAKGNPQKFSVTSNQQIAYLLFIKLGNVFNTLTKGGKAKARDILGKVPYNHKAKREFISTLQEIGDKPYRYIQCDGATLEGFEEKYEWVKKLLQLRDSAKTLSTYVQGILRGLRYGIINPGFLQAGTTSGRYSSRQPNFQNLPRDDKRIKSCIIARPGRVFVGADYSQLEPRVFASVSQDETLMGCFASGEDFYSVVGAPIFNITDCDLVKDDDNPNCFAVKHKKLRNISKAFALATPYGTSAFQQAEKLKMAQQEAQSIIERYFDAYPRVKLMQLESHESAKTHGVVYSLYGRPRRIPEAMKIEKIYGICDHEELPYEARTLLNLAMNHRVQSTGASIVNRAMIAFKKRMLALGIDAKIILQVHDEIIIECREEDAEIVKKELQHAMETTTILPGVQLIAVPKVAKNLAELK